VTLVTVPALLTAHHHRPPTRCCPSCPLRCAGVSWATCTRACWRTPGSWRG